MKAAQISGYGGPEVLVTNDGVVKPSAPSGQVLVAVHAAGVNPWDWKVRVGQVQQSIPLRFPATLGGDLAGVVVELGEGVREFKVGDEVYGSADSTSSEGSFAEFAPARASSLAIKPAGISFVEAAALPLAACSAYIGLVELLRLASGQKILIQGGAGGIGSVAVQLAKQLGAYVAATASTDDISFVKSLGADEVIDYKEQDFTQVVKDYDAVFDTVGGETALASYRVLKKGGALASMVEPPHEELMQRYGVQAVYESSGVNGERLQAVTRLVDSGALKIVVDKVFPLAQAGEALGYLQNGHPRGKVVISVRD